MVNGEWSNAISLQPSAMSGLDRLCGLSLLPVLQEFLEADAGERMVEQRIDHRRWAGRDVGAHARRFDDVNRVTAARDEDFRGEVVVVVDLDDLLDQLHTVGPDVVEAADERADVGRPGL